MKNTIKKDKSANIKIKKKRSAKKQVKQAKDSATIQNASLPNLSSINISKVLSNFMTFRTFLKNVNNNLSRLENFMDSSYQMFNIAQNIIAQNKKKPGGPFAFLFKKQEEEEKNPKKKSLTEDDENNDLPILNLPEEQPKRFRPLRNIDLNEVFKLMQSPLFQKMVSRLIQKR